MFSDFKTRGFNLEASQIERTAHPGQRTPSGQRSWRTSAKHLASSSSPERLTKSDAGMIEGSLHEGGNRSAAPIIRSEVPRDRYPLPALNTPEANKSQRGYRPHQRSVSGGLW